MKKVSSPFSTGSGGPSFEHSVQAAFIASFLVGGTLPIFGNYKINSIRLQARQSGFETDDLVAYLRDPKDIEHKLLTQIKHTISISASDDAFRSSIAAAWHDFNNPKIFNPDLDAIALITGPLSGAILNHFRTILDWSRSCAGGDELFAKVFTAHFSSKEKQTYLTALKLILEKENNGPLTNDQIWEFCRIFYLVNYDFDQKGSAAESNVITMIKLAQNSASTEAPDLIWSKILKFTQEANQNAATVTLETIPPEIRDFFSPHIKISKSESVARLKEHGNEILNIINDSLIGGIHIERSGEVEALLDLFNTNQYLIVTGEAGIGKSALTKNFIDWISADYPVFTFKAEEFNHPHIDQVLSSININETFGGLSARFSLMPNKVLFIDSTERLFESKHQDAFKMLLARVKSDSSWKLIIACRGYAIEQVRNHLCFPLGIAPETYIVPKLTDTELDFLLEKVPEIRKLLLNERLRDFLSNPFYLNQAMKIPWESYRGVENLNRGTFKSIIWNTIIKNEIESDQGMPFKRESCFLEISVRRAKTMQTFVDWQNCDPAAITKLIQDHLIVSTDYGLAPTHDLLEDWAVEQWISVLYKEHNADPSKLFQELGTEPAIRRAFRHWSKERLEGDSSENQINFITDVIKSNTIPQYWQDDVITSLLMTEKISSYLSSEKTFLFSNNKKLFIRILHLLRVACKGPDELLLKQSSLTQRGIDIFGTIFLKPFGPGWPTIIKFIYDNINEFNLDHYGVICRTIEDYLSLVRAGYLPLVAREAGLIALYFLYLLQEKNALYRDDACIKIIIKVPGAIKKEITDLINYELKSYSETGSHRDRIIIEYLNKFTDCAYLCESILDLVIKAALESWFIRDNERPFRDSGIDIGKYFGLTDYLHHEYFPASGYQGPFFFLLNNHPRKAINFIIELVNRCTRYYANSTLDKGSGDPPRQVPLKLDDKKSKLLWGSERIWTMYRGTSVGPGLLESALMALENWLFGQVDQKKDVTKAVEVIMEKAESVALISVLASLATAYPFLLKERALDFLKTRKFFEWDFIRQNRDMHHVTDIRPMMGFPSRGGVEEFHYEERKESQKRKHRQYNLEYLSINLQATDLRGQVCDIIDSHLQELPPRDRQDYGDKTWRIALQRMDIRKYSTEVDEEKKAVILQSTKLDDDLEQMIADSKPEQEKFTDRLRLQFWAKNIYDGKEDDGQYYQDINEALKDGKRIYKEIVEAKQNNEIITNEGGPAFLAAICMRDHLDELNEEDKKWCFEVLQGYLVEDMDSFDQQVRHSKFSLLGSRPAAFIMPLFLGVLGKKYDAKVKELIAVGLTHASDEVRSYATVGVRAYLFDKDPDYARACFGGLVEYSKMEMMELIPLYQKSWGENKAEAEKKIVKKIRDLRDRIACGKSIIKDENWKIDFDTYSTFKLQYALSLVLFQKGQKQYIYLYHSTLNAIIKNIKRDNKGWSRRERHYEFEYTFAELFAQFALNQTEEDLLYLCEPIFQAVITCPEVVDLILPNFFYTEDRIKTGNKFWMIWQKVAEQVPNHPAIDQEYLYGHHQMEKIVRTLLLSDVKWKDGVKEWEPLTEHEAFVKDLACKIGHTGTGFSALVSLLESAIGAPFLPRGFIWLNDSLKKSNSNKILSKKGTAFLLENVLRKFIHGGNFSKFRSDEKIIRSIINLLDALVDSGSSVAFQLREYVVTPFGGVVTLQF